jgi:hypothetical protein
MGQDMNTKLLTTLLALTLLAMPAAVPASQPAQVSMADLDAPVQLTSYHRELEVLLVDPARGAELRIVLPSGFTTLEAIDQDPFLL